ncbi:GntR family transcriptional regulator [Streptomyces sp. NPDC127108]|uniref:GntR family transcriptional regulator n=1 Tax=Streptomyces sp. NPDC127108 TaxID=3345361 RepID=UPI0036443CEA
MAATDRNRDHPFIERRPPMYMQVAQHLAKEIQDGTYAGGDLIPSEAQLVSMFGVSKHTVRQAVAELRGMGLVDVRQGKQPMVRYQTTATAALTVDRSVYRTGKAWQMPDDLTDAETPAVSRITIDGQPAALLDQQDQDALCIDRTLHDPQTGVRVAHRLIIPLATAAEAPGLAEAPDAPLAEIYARLADGRTLTITESVTARVPYPDERTSLGLADASPLLITYRVISDETGRPLICEELRAAASRVQIVYAITPTRRPAARKTATRSAPASA